MLTTYLLAALVALAIVAVCANYLERSPITLPMICLSVGALIWFLGGISSSHSGEENNHFLRIVAEATLAVVLFADASTLKLARFRHELSWPVRMLLIGLPIAFLLGSITNYFLFPEIGIWGIVLLAALLAPTDAALGASIFSNQSVPIEVRDSALAESGLNDGLALPFIIFAACAAVGGQHQFAGDGWLVFAAKQIGFGMLSGAAAGMIGGTFLNKAITLKLATPKQGSMFVLLLVAIVFFISEELHGNSFVAVFIAGIFFNTFAKDHAHAAKEFLETEGLLLTMASFVFIGAFIIPNGFLHVNWQIFLAVFLSLFVVRPAAVWLSLIGTDAPPKTRLFLGWFGPRGLATALFAIFVLVEFDTLEYGETIIAVTAFAVVCSTFLHGISAHWAGLWFATQPDTKDKA